MAQFIIGFAAGIYIGTHYNCRPGLRLASDTLEQYCPKREPTSDYVPINGNDEPVEDKKEKNIELTPTSKPFNKWF
tara:strand:- start:880 stop:1107 length:228 start_codon:yes stop_codon:yes gene_type:complete